MTVLDQVRILARVPFNHERKMKIKRDIPLGIVFVLLSIFFISPIMGFLDPAFKTWWILPLIVILCSVYNRLVSYGLELIIGVVEQDDSEKR